jgi:metal-responsive CopG/Arc/MetJ family transcriptional regulator
MKIAISISEELFDSAETLGKRLGLSRSRLYATALEDFVAKHQARKITERLNSMYASQDSRLDRATRRLQARSLNKKPW